MKKTGIIISIIAVLILLIGGGYFLLKVDHKTGEEKTKDAEKFSKEYTEVSKNNVFVYKEIDEIIKIMENGTGVVYLGYPECPWCQAYVPYLNEVAKEVGMDKIYYYNIKEARANNSEEYKKIVSILENELQYDDEGNKRIYVPNVSFHIKGKVIGNDYETSLDTHDLKDPKEYWTKEEVKDLKEKLTKYMEEVNKERNICTDCNK